MKQIGSFRDLQNETVEIYDDGIGNFYIGRRASRMMNLNLAQVEQMLLICKKQLSDEDIKNNG